MLQTSTNKYLVEDFSTFAKITKFINITQVIDKDALLTEQVSRSVNYLQKIEKFKDDAKKFYGYRKETFFTNKIVGDKKNLYALLKVLLTSTFRKNMGKASCWTWNFYNVRI